MSQSMIGETFQRFSHDSDGNTILVHIKDLYEFDFHFMGEFAENRLNEAFCNYCSQDAEWKFIPKPNNYLDSASQVQFIPNANIWTHSIWDASTYKNNIK